VPGIHLDELDLRILAILQSDSSVSNVELAARAHASPPTCLRRVSKLKEAGVIQREVAILDYAKIGPTLTAIIEVSLDRQAAEDLDAFETYICAEAVVTQCYRVSPGPDFLVVAEVVNMPEHPQCAHILFDASGQVRSQRAGKDRG